MGGLQWNTGQPGGEGFAERKVKVKRELNAA